MREYINKEDLLSDYPIQEQLDDLVSHLSAQGWSTNFKSYAIETDGDGFLLYCQIYKGLYAEYYTENGITLDDRVHIVLLDKEGGYDWVDGFNLTESKQKAFEKADDLEIRLYEKSRKDWYTIGCDAYHERKDG